SKVTKKKSVVQSLN
ncbi:sigma-70 factor, region 1.2 family protein, partial [Vibrio harveyi]